VTSALHIKPCGITPPRHATTSQLSKRTIRSTISTYWSILTISKSKRVLARNPDNTPVAAVHPIKKQSNPPVSREARNRASTKRNSVKVEHHLMEVEKAHGFAKSWALREQLEQGQISFDELMRR
jgi:hypothetical protein